MFAFTQLASGKLKSETIRFQSLGFNYYIILFGADFIFCLSAIRMHIITPFKKQNEFLNAPPHKDALLSAAL